MRTLKKPRRNAQIIKEKKQTRYNTQLQVSLDFYDFVDIWRNLYPKVKQYTFFSHTHLVHSQIDYLLGSKSFFPII